MSAVDKESARRAWVGAHGDDDGFTKFWNAVEQEAGIAPASTSGPGPGGPPVKITEREAAEARAWMRRNS